MAYIPPALRRKGGIDQTSSLAPELPALEDQVSQSCSEVVFARDIMQHFWPANGSDIGTTSSTTADASTYVPERSTLNASAATPDNLAFVLVFRDANPTFASDGTIYVKTNLNLLQPYINARRDSAVQNDDGVKTTPDLASASNGQPAPIPFFSQVCRVHRHKPKDTFRFSGYFTVDSVTVHTSRSSSLAQMLERKWTHSDSRGNQIPKPRNAANWLRSLDADWAEVRFRKDDEYERLHGVPNVISTQEPVRSVNEMLREARMQG